MPTDITRVKNGLIAAYQDMRTANPGISADDAMDMLMTAVATVVVTEIKNLKINYTSGLVVGANPVTGIFNHTTA